MLDGKKYTFIKGSIVAVNSNVIHYTSTEEYLKYTCLIVDTSFCNRIGLDYTAVEFVPLIQNEMVANLFEDLKLIYQNNYNPYRQAELYLAVIRLLLELCKNYTNTNLQSAVRNCSFENVKAAVRFIRENYDRKLSLDEISKSVCTNKYTLSREFKKITGQTIVEYTNMDTEEGVYVGATQTDFIASAFFVNSLALVVKVGRILGENVIKYELMHENAKKAFIKDGMPVLYKNGDCKDRSNEKRYQRTLKSITQTSLTLLLKFDLCLCDERKAIAKKLVDLIRENDNRLTTGFVGTPYLLHALSESGYADVAYDLLLQEDCPSWLYSVNHGATTIWEHWDGVKEDGSFWSPEMNSFNHYAYGAVYDWIFGVAAGIKIDEDGIGYKCITISPNPEKRIGFMDVQYQTKTGLLRSSWRYIENGIEYSFTIPQDTVAKILFPKGTTHILQNGDYLFIEKIE